MDTANKLAGGQLTSEPSNSLAKASYVVYKNDKHLVTTKPVVVKDQEQQTALRKARERKISAASAGGSSAQLVSDRTGKQVGEFRGAC